MDYLIRQADRLSTVAVWVAGATLIGMSLLVCGDVVARWYFNASLAGTDELGGYVVAITSAWAFSYALFRRAHIRIDSLSRLLPARLRTVFDVIGLLALGTFMALMTLRCWTVAASSWELGARSITPLRIPLWIPQYLWLLGLLFFVVVIVLLLARSVIALARGEYRTVARLIGTRSVDEEVAEEIRG